MTKRVLGVLVFILIFSFLGCISEKSKEMKTSDEKNVVISLEVGSDQQRVNYTILGDLRGEYERSGVQSFTVLDGKFYLLNGASNSIKVVGENGIEESIEYDSSYSPFDIEMLDKSTAMLLFESGEYAKISLDASKRGKRDITKMGSSQDEDISLGIIKKNGEILVKQKGEEVVDLIGNKRRRFSRNDFIKLSEEKDEEKTLIGFDDNGNIYILSTKLIYNETGNLDIEEVVYKTTKEGEVLGVAKVYDNKNFISPKKKLYVSEEGKLYQLCTYENTLEILELEFKEEIVSEYQQKKQNLKKKEQEINQLIQKRYNSNGQKLTRSKMNEKANEIVNLRWNFNSYNNRTKSSNVYLPRHLRSVSGTRTMTGIPYCWGGSDTTSSFVSRINASYTAGNVRCREGYKGGTTGVDCSGFVSKVWGTKYKLGTSMIIDNGWIRRISYSQMKPMDILVKRGHVMFFLETYSEGVITLEATTGGTEQRAKRYKRKWDYLRNEGYIAGRYVNTIEGEDKVNLQAIGGKGLEYNEANGTYDMKVFVKNETSGNSGEFSVTLWINGEVYRKDNISINGQKTIEVSIGTNITEPKEYSYSYLVDSRAQVNETDESDVDNKYSGKVKAMGQYNLRATGDVKAEKTGNGTYDIYVGVSNEYLESIVGYSVTLWINGGVYRVDNQSIAGGSETYHKLASNISKADIYDYAYLVDSRAQVKETNESDRDNKRSGQIKIGENIPEPEYKLSLEGVYEVTPNEYVEYRGELGAGISKVAGYIDGVQLRSLITNIEGNTYSIKFALNKRLGELRELKVVAEGKDGKSYTATKEIQMLGSELEVSYAKEVKLGEILNFGGEATGISEVEIKVDIYRISPVEKIKVVDGKFSYNYRFSGRGEDRKVYINGYNSAGKLVKTIEDTITVR